MLITDPKYPKYYGCGIVNARKALIETPPPPPVASGAPVAADDAATTAEGTPTDVAVLANDTDPNGDTLAVTAATDPAHGTTAIQPNGTVRYTPERGLWPSTNAFDYTVGDGTGECGHGLRRRHRLVGQRRAGGGRRGLDRPATRRLDRRAGERQRTSTATRSG